MHEAAAIYRISFEQFIVICCLCRDETEHLAAEEPVFCPKAMLACSSEFLKEAPTGPAGSEPSVCAEGEATQAQQGDASSPKPHDGQDSDSPTEPQDDQHDGSRSSLERDGPLDSVGSVGHPTACTPCTFYCFSRRGCWVDRDCKYCHLFHQSLKQRRGQRTKRKALKSASAAMQAEKPLPKRDPTLGKAQPFTQLPPRVPPPPGLAMNMTSNTSNPSTSEGRMEHDSSSSSLSNVSMASSPPSQGNLPQADQIAMDRFEYTPRRGFTKMGTPEIDPKIVGFRFPCNKNANKVPQMSETSPGTSWFVWGRCWSCGRCWFLTSKVAWAFF